MKKQITNDALDFAEWLMENCELAEDNSLWSYRGEDYTNERLYQIYTEEVEFANSRPIIYIDHKLSKLAHTSMNSLMLFGALVIIWAVLRSYIETQYPGLSHDHNIFLPWIFFVGAIISGVVLIYCCVKQSISEYKQIKNRYNEGENKDK